MRRLGGIVFDLLVAFRRLRPTRQLGSNIWSLRCASLVLWPMLLALSGLISAVPCLSAEPAERFLQALRDAGLHDMAVEYLQQMETSPLAGEDFRSRVPFELAQTLLRSARETPDNDHRLRQLEQATRHLKEFLTANPEHAEASAARAALRSVGQEKARLAMNAAESADSPAARQAALDEARQLFLAGQRQLTERLEEIRGQLEAMQKLPPGQLDAEQRNQLRAEYLESKLNLAIVAYELAETVKDNPELYKRDLTAAIAAFSEVAEKYRNRLAGLHSVFYLGRCHQELGDYREALSYYHELLELKEAPELVRALGIKTARYAIECLLAENNAEAAVKIGVEWLPPGSTAFTTADGLGLKLALAKAQVAAAESSPGRAGISLTLAARKHAAAVARISGPWQQPARALLINMQGGEAEPLADVSEVAKFADAKSAGDDARIQLQQAETILRLVQPKLATTQDPQRRRELKERLELARQQSSQARQQALAYYRRALELADDSVDEGQLNELRYFLAYLFFGEQRYLEAAVLSEFIARRYPSSPAALPCSRIAMACYLKLLGEADTGHDASFGSERLVAIADYVALTWPGRKEALEALTTLVSFMVNQGKPAEAEAYLEKIPATSPARADAELRTGQALWQAYRRQNQTPSEQDTAEKRLALRARAEALLQQGLARQGETAVTGVVLRAALALAQIHVDAGAPQLAQALLSDERIGPQRLVEQKAPAADIPGFAAETYRTALQASIAELATDGNDEALESAMQIVDKLGEVFGDTEDDRRKLIGVYVAVAGDLQAKLNNATPENRQKLAAALESFLDRVARDSQQLSVQNWIAETFFALGERFDGSTAADSTDATQYYRKAKQSFANILKQQASGQLQLEPALVRQIRMRMASISSRLGNYEQAVDLFAEVLAAQDNILTLQMEAARALQDGADAGKTGWYTLAIKGDRRNSSSGKNVIWGWERTARITGPYMRRKDAEREKFADAFFESQYNVAYCRYRQGLAGGGDDRQKYLLAAKRIVNYVSGSFPELGGATRRGRFNALMKQIQQALGEPATGIQEAGGR